MSVVNKMLNDLDARSALDDDDGADYQEPAENKRIRYMIAFIAFVILSAAGYFTYRAMPEYFQDLYVQTMQFINGEEPEQENIKKVKVNSALDQMMPARNASALEVSAQEQQPAQAAPTEQSKVTTASNSIQATEGEEQTLVSANVETEEIIDSTNDIEAVSNQQDAGVSEDTDSEGPQDLISIPLAVQSFVQLSDSDELQTEIASLNSEAVQGISENDVSKAVRAYRQILEIDEYSHDARKKLAVLHYSINEIGSASTVLNQGIEIEPERVDFRLMLARLFYRQKQLKQAYAVLAQIEPDVQRNIDFYGLKATVAQELELNAESSHLYGRLVIFEPNRAQWWLGLAISLDRLGQREGALRAYENASDLRQLSASADDFIRQRILELGG